MLVKLHKSMLCRICCGILSGAILASCHNGAAKSTQLTTNHSLDNSIKTSVRNDNVDQKYIPFESWKEWKTLKDGSQNAAVTQQIVYNGKLFVLFFDGSLKSYDGTKWTTFIEAAINTKINKMAIFQNQLYLGYSNGTIKRMLNESTSSVDNIVFVPLPTEGYKASSVTQMFIYNNKLIIGQINGMVIECDGTNLQVLHDDSWKYWVTQFAIYQNKLIVSLANGNIQEWNDGSWKQISASDWQTSPNQMLVYKDKLIVGFANGSVKQTDGVTNKELLGSSVQQPVKQMVVYHDKLIVSFGNGLVKQWDDNSWKELHGTSWNASVNQMIVYNDSIVVGLSSGEVWAWNDSENKWFLLQNNSWSSGINFSMITYNNALTVGLDNGAIKQYGTQIWRPKYSEKPDPVAILDESAILHDMDCTDTYIIPDVSSGSYITKQEIKVCALATTSGVYLGFVNSSSSSSSYPTEWKHIKNLGDDPAPDIHGVVVTSDNIDTGRIVQVGDQLNNVREPIVHIVGVGENGKVFISEFNPYEVYNNESSLSRIYTEEIQITSHDLYQVIYTSNSSGPAYLSIGKDTQFIYRSLDGKNWQQVAILPDDYQKVASARLRKVYEHILYNGKGAALNTIKCGFGADLLNRCLAVGDSGIILVSDNSGQSWVPAYNADPRLWYNQNNQSSSNNSPKVGILYSIASKYSEKSKMAANIIAGPHTLLYSANLAAWNPIQLPDTIANEDAYFSIFDVTVQNDVEVVKNVDGQLVVSKENLFVVRLMLPDGSLSDISITSEDGMNWLINDGNDTSLSLLYERLPEPVENGFKKSKINPPLPGMPYFIYAGLHSADSFTAINFVVGQIMPFMKDPTGMAVTLKMVEIALSSMLQSDDYRNKQAHVIALTGEAMKKQIPEFFNSLGNSIEDAYQAVVDWFNTPLW